MLERRKSNRFQGQLTVELENGTGVTRDFGALGVYFDTDRTFALSDLVEFTLNFDHAEPGAGLRVHCQGTVLRVEPKDETIGIAVAIDSLRFEGLGESWLAETGVRGTKGGKNSMGEQETRLPEGAEAIHPEDEPGILK